MTREEILGNWDGDAQINAAKLADEALNVPRLHAKYWRFLSNEKIILRMLESDLKVLALEKYEFLTQGPTKETVAKGWVLPPRGCILKGDADRYLDADKDLINLSLKVANQKEKVAILDDIIKSLNARNWSIRNAITFQQFQAGVNG